MREDRRLDKEWEAAITRKNWESPQLPEDVVCEEVLRG